MCLNSTESAMITSIHPVKAMSMLYSETCIKHEVKEIVIVNMLKFASNHSGSVHGEDMCIAHSNHISICTLWANIDELRSICAESVPYKPVIGKMRIE